MEIIPQQDPYTVGAGQTLQVQVLFQGKPQAGVTVEYDGGEPVTTNEQGIASVTLKDKEVHIIESEFSIPSTDDEAADEIGYASSLTIDKAGNGNFRR